MNANHDDVIDIEEKSSKQRNNRMSRFRPSWKKNMQQGKQHARKKRQSSLTSYQSINAILERMVNSPRNRTVQLESLKALVGGSFVHSQDDNGILATSAVAAAVSHFPDLRDLALDALRRLSETKKYPSRFILATTVSLFCLIENDIDTKSNREDDVSTDVEPVIQLATLLLHGKSPCGKEIIPWVVFGLPIVDVEDPTTRTTNDQMESTINEIFGATKSCDWLWGSTTSTSKIEDDFYDKFDCRQNQRLETLAALIEPLYVSKNTPFRKRASSHFLRYLPPRLTTAVIRRNLFICGDGYIDDNDSNTMVDTNNNNHVSVATSEWMAIFREACMHGVFQDVQTLAQLLHRCCPSNISDETLDGAVECLANLFDCPNESKITSSSGHLHCARKCRGLVDDILNHVALSSSCDDVADLAETSNATVSSTTTRIRKGRLNRKDQLQLIERGCAVVAKVGIEYAHDLKAAANILLELWKRSSCVHSNHDYSLHNNKDGQADISTAAVTAPTRTATPVGSLCLKCFSIPEDYTNMVHVCPILGHIFATLGELLQEDPMVVSYFADFTSRHRNMGPIAFLKVVGMNRLLSLLEKSLTIKTDNGLSNADPSVYRIVSNVSGSLWKYYSDHYKQVENNDSKTADRSAGTNTCVAVAMVVVKSTLSVLLRVIKSYPVEDFVQEAVLNSLCRLCDTSSLTGGEEEEWIRRGTKVVLSRLDEEDRKGKLLEHIRFAMVAHIDVEAIQEHGCALHLKLLQFRHYHQSPNPQSDDKNNSKGIDDCGHWVRCVLTAAAKHTDNCSLQTVVSQLLLEILLHQTKGKDSFAGIPSQIVEDMAKPLLLGNRLNFPQECGETVDKILSLFKQCENNSKSDKDNGGIGGSVPNPLSLTSKVLHTPTKVEPIFTTSETANIDHDRGGFPEVVFLGATNVERQFCIDQLVHHGNNDDDVDIVRPKHCANGVVEHCTWYPFGGGRSSNDEGGKSGSNDCPFRLEILNCYERVIPDLFFPPHATYVVVWFTKMVDVEDHNNERNKFKALARRIDHEVTGWVDHVETAFSIKGSSRIVVVGILHDIVDDKNQINAHRTNRLDFFLRTHQWSWGNRLSSLPSDVILLRNGKDCHGNNIKNDCDSSLLRQHILEMVMDDDPTTNRMIMSFPHLSQSLSSLLFDAVSSAVDALKRTHPVLRWSTFVDLLQQHDEVNYYASQTIRYDTATLTSSSSDLGLSIALQKLFTRGSIRYIRRENGKGDGYSDFNKDTVVVLDNVWLATYVRCIIGGDSDFVFTDNFSYDGLRLSVEETKEDLQYNLDYDSDDDFGDDNENNFYSLFVNCPVISLEDTQLLWRNARTKGRRLAIDDEILRCLETVCVSVGVLVPLFRRQLSRQKQGYRQLFFIPSLVKGGEPPLLSLKTKHGPYGHAHTMPNNPSKRQRQRQKGRVVSGSYTVPTPPQTLMKDVTIRLLRIICDQLDDNNDNTCRLTASAECGGIRWSTVAPSNRDDEVNMNDIQAHIPTIIIHEICCWESSILIKVESHPRGTFMECMACLTDRDSPLCLAASLLGRDEQRLSVTWKGLADDAEEFGSKLYKTFVDATEGVMNDLKVCFSRHIPCPPCLQNFPIRDVFLFNMSNQNCPSDSNRVDEQGFVCPRGHILYMDRTT